MDELPPSIDLTWPALLAHWTAFAKSSLALPKTAEGERWRQAVPSIIGLQAVTYALADLDQLAKPGERALALDKAEMLIRKHAGELHALWPPPSASPSSNKDERREPFPNALAEMIEDARLARSAAVDGGMEWTVKQPRLVLDHPGELLGVLESVRFRGDLYIAAPGVVLMHNCPAAFMRGTRGETPERELLKLVGKFLGGSRAVHDPRRRPGMRQAYRQFDFGGGLAMNNAAGISLGSTGGGGPVRDVVAPMESSLPAGQPLLVAAMENGEPQAVPLPPRRVQDVPDLPVVFEGEE